MRYKAIISVLTSAIAIAGAIINCPDTRAEERKDQNPGFFHYVFDASSDRGKTLYIIKEDNNLYYHTLQHLPPEYAAFEWLIFEDVVSFDMGHDTCLMVKTDGSLWGYGPNKCGELGIGSTDSVSYDAPVKIMDDVSVAKTSSSLFGEFTLILKRDGSLWGVGLIGEHMGIGSDDEIRRITNVIDVDTGRVRGGMDGSTTLVKNPCVVKPIKIMDDIQSFNLESSNDSRNPFYVHAVKKDGTLWAWGSRMPHVLGTDALGEYRISVPSLQPVKIMDDVASVSGKITMMTALKKDGSVWAWGDCMLEQGTDPFKIKSSSSITPIHIMDGFVEINSVAYQILALKADGSLWLWGANYVFGYPSEELKLELTPKKVMDDIVAFSNDAQYAAVMKTDGSIWAWGVVSEEDADRYEPCRPYVGEPVKIIEAAPMPIEAEEAGYETPNESYDNKVDEKMKDEDTIRSSENESQKPDSSVPLVVVVSGIFAIVGVGGYGFYRKSRKD